MRVLITTDAWHPQVNGVVRTLTSLAANLGRLGVHTDFLTPEGFRTFPLPTYSELRCAIPNSGEVARRIGRFRPDAIHIATEGPLGYLVRRYCRKRGLPFTTSYTTRFPEYIHVRTGIPLSLSYAVLRRFHAAANVTMVSTVSLMNDLTARGFKKLGMWTRGVDTGIFRPDNPAPLDLPRPIFAYAGRVAVEKNIEAFLALDLPGTKIVIGDGPHRTQLQQKYPSAKFLGVQHGAALASHIAAADVFVFPSLTDTFGVVQLEALACGVPVAAFPVMGPNDVIGNAPVGVIDNDLRAACLGALSLSRQACREFALSRSWETSARQFMGHLAPLAAGAQRAARPAKAAPAPARA